MCVQEVTELKDSQTATDTQLPTATSDYSRTLSELHRNDEESAPVITRAQYAGGLCVCVRLLLYVYMWVIKKHACLRLTARKSQ